MAVMQTRGSLLPAEAVSLSISASYLCSMNIQPSRSFLIATDLDGTFLGGDTHSKEKLYAALQNTDDVCLVFVTGRGLDSVLPLFDMAHMPRPDYIICDVGATIVHGTSLEPVTPIQEEIEGAWPGADTVRAAFEPLKGLRYQEVPQQRRSSYYFDQNADMKHIAGIAEQLQVDIIVSHGKYVDVLPAGTNKGSTLKKLVTLLDHPREAILVAGDTLNDLSLFETGFKGVVVGDAEEGLLHFTKKMDHIYHADAPGTGGILQAIEHFNIPVSLNNTPNV